MSSGFLLYNNIGGGSVGLEFEIVGFVMILAGLAIFDIYQKHKYK